MELTKCEDLQFLGVQVRFRVQPGGRKASRAVMRTTQLCRATEQVQAVDRKNRCAWTKSGEEVPHGATR